MSGFTRGAVLAGLSILGPSLWEVSAQVPNVKDAPAPARRKPVDAFNRVEGESTVVKLKPAGTVVKKGEWVVEFDASRLRDELARQTILVQAAVEAHRAATMTREVAEIGVQEFTDGISKEDIERADAAIADATSKRLRAEDLARRSKSAADQHNLTEARFTEEKAKAKKAILLKYTEAKDLKALQGAVFQAKEEELKREGVWQRERLKGEKLRRQIDACTVVAPTDGTVGYPRPAEVGDTFRQAEVVFQVFPDPTPRPDSRPN